LQYILGEITMANQRPNPNEAFPNPNLPRLCFIKNVVKNPRIIIGDYTYYDDVDGADQFEKHVTHFYDFIGDKLIIGKFCAIAKGVEFVMNGANHRMDCATTYPFYIMGGDWGSAIALVKDDLPLKGDTIIGNDVWIGQNVTVMPGVHIGDGAIIGTNSVVAKDIPPYSIAVGNPCQVVRKRFDDELIELLLQFRWWDKSIEEIENLMPILSCCNVEKVKAELRAFLQVERIKWMEQRFNNALAAIKDGAAVSLESIKEDVAELSKYYGSDLWKQDFAADEAGILPPDLKRGVLSEDGIWNLLSDYREIQKKYGRME